MKADKQLRVDLTKAGWRIIRQNKHQVWECPDGRHKLVLPTSASDERGIKNKRADLRRTGCEYQIRVKT